MSAALQPGSRVRALVTAFRGMPPPAGLAPRSQSWRFFSAVAAAYLLGAFWVTGRLWLSPNGRLLQNEQDHIFFEWMFAHGQRVLFDGANPFFTQQLNAPDGVNLIANTSI